MKYLLAFLVFLFVLATVFYFSPPVFRIVGFFLPMVVGNWPDPM
jgi:hypothetical protein